MGFACLAAGLTMDNIRGVDAPWNYQCAVDRKIAQHPILRCLSSFEEVRVIDPTTGKSDEAGPVLARINDAEVLAEETRERWIMEVGEQIGMRFRFVN